MTDSGIPGWKDKVLFTPGPLTTSATVKQAMLRDLGSRDAAFLEIVRDIREKLLAIGQVESPAYVAIPMQGSGTFALESVLGSTISPQGRLLVIRNGAYGARLTQMARVLKIDVVELACAENALPDLAAVEARLNEDRAIETVAVVHCETTTGIVNPIDVLGELVGRYGCRYFVDAMSSFGALPIALADCRIDYLVSSANKCIEGVPGFAFVLARREPLEATAGWARSLSLDLLAQFRGLEANGQFRFTPPTHALLAFHQALVELEQEGGVAARQRRYLANHQALRAGMRERGFVEYLDAKLQGPIITSFRYPDHPAFDFETFYRDLSEQGYVIYPGKVSDAECFRIGTIGRIFPTDVEDLLAAIDRVRRRQGWGLAATTSQG